MTSGPPTPQGGHDRLRGDLFGSQASNYDRLRPLYPSQLFQLLIRETKLSPESSVLEIGSGSGFATVPVAELGCSLVAVEPAPELAEITRSRIRDYEKATVITARFEDVDFPDESFDLIYGATSVHWVDPEVLSAKSHRLLKNGGFLAFIYNELVEESGNEPFFEALEPLVKQYGVTSLLRAGTTPETVPSSDGKIAKTMDSLKRRPVDRSLFDQAGFAVTKPPIPFEYNTEEYIGYLQTISSILSLPNAEREAFLADARRMVETQFAGHVTLHFSATIQLSKKKTPQA